MATMIPERAPAGAPASERRVFELLRDDPATDGWVALHSSAHAGVAGGRPREVDFVVLIPNCGLLCVEVKGGAFDIRGGQWRAQASGEPMEAPVQQAEQAMYALQAELEREFGSESDIGRMPTDCVVVFTDVDWPDAVRRPARTVIDHADLASDRSLGQRLLATALRFRRVDRRGPGRLPSAGTMDRLRRYLSPDFTLELVSAVGPQLDIIDEQLIRLTEEQYAALDLVRDNDRCLFRGAAGTGKTMLAVECARRAAAAGHRTALVCYNRLLGHWLAEQTQGFVRDRGIRDRGIRGDGGGLIAAGAFWDGVMRPLIVGSPEGRDFEGIIAGGDEGVSERELYEEVYPEYARRALRHSGPRFEALIMDEAQDLCQSPYLELADLALAGGLGQGRWAMFGDFGNQAIFLSQAGNPEGALRGYCEHPARRNLLINCRNTPPIARHTARLARSEPPETRLREAPGPLPQYRYWRDDGELSDLLDEEVHRLLGQDVRIGEMVALATRRLVNTGLDLVRTYGSYPLVDHSRGQRLPAAGDDDGGEDDDAAHLKFCTVHSFKGMESNVVILILDRLERQSEETDAYVYVGMSRARGALTVLANAALRGEVEARLAASS